MSRREEVGVGLLLLAGLGATAFLALQTGALSSWGDRVEVTAASTDAAGLQEGSVVSALGVEVGKVSRIELDGQRVVVHLSLLPDAGMRVGTRARVRARSLLGEKYVELAPGPPEALLLADGDALPPMPPQFEVDELIDALGSLIATFDPGLLRDLADALAKLEADDPGRLPRMLDDLGVLLHNARIASEDLPSLAVDAREAIAQARSTLAAVGARATDAAATLDRADAVLEKLSLAADPLPGTVAEARQALIEARALIEHLDGVSTEVDAVLLNLEAFDIERIESLLRDEGIRVRFAGRGGKD